MTDRNAIKRDIEALVAKYGANRSALMPILHECETMYRHVSAIAMEEVAFALSIKPVEVQSVVTFFSHYHTAPTGRFVIRLCRSQSCEMQGAGGIADALKSEIGIDFGQTSADGMFTLEAVSCIGLCDQAPAMLVNDKPYTNLSVEDIGGIITSCRSEGKEQAA
ncbi:MAG: NAD(P)H-dependent oxidoreductase subunit E [Pseudomonadota bacterium]|nr:NAD(P)H-dependent oxidoreductase subunit E [Pseudomonadota bacterium]